MSPSLEAKCCHLKLTAVAVPRCSKVGSNDLPTKFEGTGPQFADVLTGTGPRMYLENLSKIENLPIKHWLV